MFRSSLFLLVFLTAFSLRFFGLGAVLTADEERWMIRAGAYNRALAAGDIGATFQGTHPGVTTMLLAGGGIRVFELLSREQFRNEENVGEFRLAAKLPLALATSALLGVIAVIVAALWGTAAGVSAGIFLALDPFLLGLSQLVHVDALVSLLMASSVLALLLFLRRGERRIFILSGFLGGLALLTKLPALYLVAFMPLALLLERWKGDAGLSWSRVIRRSVAWIAVAGVTVVLLWPSMWLHFLGNVNFARRDVVTVVTQPHFTESEYFSRDQLFYPRALLAHATPLALLLAGAAFAFSLRPGASQHRRRVVWLWIVYVLGFLLLLTLASKRADRYVLPASVPLALLAGMAFSEFFERRRVIALLVGSAAVLSLAVTDLLLAPYALAYRNTFIRRHEYSQEGFGEGLETAAGALNAHPLAAELEVAAWYPGVFRHFFRGKTFSLSSRDDPRTDYVVLYRNMYGRSPDDPATEVLREFAQETPERTVRILGVPSAWIYRTDAVDIYTSHVGEIRRGMEVGQLIPVPRAGLSGIRLVFATFSSRPNTAAVVLHVRESPSSTQDLRTVTVNASKLEDSAWHTFVFPPIADSAGKTYYVFVTSPNGAAGNAVTVRFRERDIEPGQMVFLKRPLRDGETRASFTREGDLGYRLLFSP